MWPFIISGLVVGSIYGLASTGLVLTYKATGVFNFAQGAIATIAAYVFYELHIVEGMTTWLAAIIAVLGVGVVVGLLFERLARSLQASPLAVQVTSTVGILLIVQAAVILIYGTIQTREVPTFLGTGEFKLAGTYVQYSQLWTFVFAVAVTLLLWLFFRFARLGRSMRAVVDDPNLLELTGTSASAVRRSTWLIGVTFAAASGVLFASLQPLDPTTLTLLVVQAFGAAAIAAFRNLPLSFFGGLIIGVLASLCTKWFTGGLLESVPSALPFIVLFVVLLVFPKRYLTTRRASVPWARPQSFVPGRIQLPFGVVLLVFFCIVPAFAGIHIDDWTTALANVILFLSLGLLVRESGQLSLGHVGFMAIGAAAFGHFSGSLGIPWVPAFLLAILIALPVGAILAIPSIRLTGLYLALATFGFGIVLSYMFYTQSFMFGDSAAALNEARPAGFASDHGFYYFVLGLTVIATLLVVALGRGRLGRLLRGMSDSPLAIVTSGASVNVTRVLVFCLSAALAAAAGALGGMAQQSVTLLSYPALQSLTYLALIMIVVGSAPWYAVIAAVATTVVPSYVTATTTNDWLQVIFGVFAVLLAVTPASARQLPPAARERLERGFARVVQVRARRDPGADASGVPARPVVAPATLELRDVTVKFGGLVAVDGMQLAARTGHITGLIGPNGAGKTTTFNVASGLQNATAGAVYVDEQRVHWGGADRRARLGLGRTFQRMELFESLSVRENVRIGVEGARAGVNPLRHLFASPRDVADSDRAINEALQLCGIVDLADRPVMLLSTGQRRLVELARCLAGDFKILLLDEPSSGLDRVETQRFGDVLRDVAHKRGVGILIVEHDMSLVMRICEHIYVLDFGKLLFEGSPLQVGASPVVQAAYLGSETPEIQAAEASTKVLS